MNGPTHLNVSKILWGAMVASVGIYAVVAWVVLAQTGAASLLKGHVEEPASQTLLVILSLLPLVNLAIIPLLRRRSESYRPGERSADRGETSAQAFTAEIATWALCEGIAIYAFVLALLFGSLVAAIPSFVLAAGALLHYRPQ